ncbi:hypothetical protein NDU88_002980 [Pleurodeles waltl]|uniref:Uncharacterized protein n=1 Tax=Pleurodeles waltl TaxID=8319 RepID=A0AAV7W0V5_PLEWA|nr:hypothetical protein NDU88_002980 [Pleurodeles waltl]
MTAVERSAQCRLSVVPAVKLCIGGSDCRKAVVHDHLPVVPAASVAVVIAKLLSTTAVERGVRRQFAWRGNGVAERAVKLFKGTLQLALTNQCDIKETISNMVWAFRTMPHSVTQRIPFVYTRGRLPGTKLVPAWLKEILHDETVFNNSVAFPKKSELRASVRVKVGDWVKVKSGRIQGGLTKFRGPFRVQRVGTYFVILENGERWNLRNVALYQKNGMIDGMIDKEFDEGCSGMMFMNDDEVVKEKG